MKTRKKEEKKKSSKSFINQHKGIKGTKEEALSSFFADSISSGRVAQCRKKAVHFFGGFQSVTFKLAIQVNIFFIIFAKVIFKRILEPPSFPSFSKSEGPPQTIVGI